MVEVLDQQRMDWLVLLSSLLHNVVCVEPEGNTVAALKLHDGGRPEVDLSCEEATDLIDSAIARAASRM